VRRRRGRKRGRGRGVRGFGIGVFEGGVCVMVGIDNLKSNGALLSTCSNSVNLSLQSFYRSLIFNIHCFGIFIGL
jgi:hypothetical protein